VNYFAKAVCLLTMTAVKLSNRGMGLTNSVKWMCLKCLIKAIFQHLNLRSVIPGCGESISAWHVGGLARIT